MSMVNIILPWMAAVTLLKDLLTASPSGAVTYGNPVESFDGCGDRVYGEDDELLGAYETVNYSQPTQDDIPGLDINDYDTDMYKDMVTRGQGGNGDIPRFQYDGL